MSLESSPGGVDSTRRRIQGVVHWLGAAALIGVVATGCGGEAAPAAQSNEVTSTTQEPATGAIGPAQEGDGMRVSIDAIRTTDASGMVDLDPSTTEIDTEPLEPGQEFLILDVTIANAGSVPHEYNALSWSAADPTSGATYQAALLGVTGYDLASGDLEPGESAWGKVAIAIPADATQLQVTYETQLLDQGTELSWAVTVP